MELRSEMDAVDVLEKLSTLGVRVTPRPNGSLWLEPASVIPPDLVEEVRQHKAAILALLSNPGPTTAPVTDLADSLEACIALGKRLATGETAALRCGITGQWCRNCMCIPCLGSSPWEG